MVTSLRLGSLADLFLTIATAPIPLIVVSFGKCPCSHFKLIVLRSQFFDFPIRYPRFWQAVVLLCAWSFPLSQLLSMRICHFYGPPRLNTCGVRDFQSLFYYTSAAPVFSLFCFRQKRHVELLGSVIFSIVGKAHPYPRNGLTGYYSALLHPYRPLSA